MFHVKLLKKFSLMFANYFTGTCEASAHTFCADDAATGTYN